MANVGNLPRYITTAAFTYAIGAYGSYRYNLIQKAQTEILMIKDQKAHLLQVHNSIAEKYDSLHEKVEWQNKFGLYRRVLLTYASGRVLELGIGTGANLQYYPAVDELVGVDWSEKMLLPAFSKLDELKKTKKFKPKNVKLRQADFLTLADSGLFGDASFDCIVDTFTLGSVYDRAAWAAQVKRLLKEDGHVLLLERGLSIQPLFNMWLQFKAAKDLLEKGKVEHLDVEEVVNQYFGDFEVVHKERKNLGRTYVYILKKSAVDKAVDVCQAI